MSYNHGGGGGGSGTVTSVSGTGTVSGLTLSGTVTSSGSLTLGGTLSVTGAAFGSQTANTVFAAPNGSAGNPSFRALVAADIPTLNQNTTGSAATLTAGRTIGMTGDVVWTSASFNGSANVTGTAAIQAGVVTLTEDRDEQYAVDLVHPKRLIFEVNHDPIPRNEDGGIDLTKVTAITIVEVVDYH